MADLKTRNGIVRAGGMTGARDILTSPSMFRWLKEGKIFSAGFGYEHAGQDDDDAIEDIFPEQGLFSAATPNILVLPILVRLSTHTEGGAAPEIGIGITRAAEDSATSMKTSAGTVFPAIQNCNSEFSNKPTARALYNITLSAMTNADYIMVVQSHAADNVVGGSGGVGFPSPYSSRGTTTFEHDMLADPYLLSDGAALLVYPNSGTGRAKYSAYLVWAELTLDDLR